LSLSGVLSKLPGVVDHEVEIGVIVNGGRDVVVVFSELLFGNDIIWSIIVSHGMSCFKSLKELLEDVILSFFA